MTYYVCSDNIDGKERQYIQDVMNELKSAGKSVANGGVGPNKEALRNSKSSGDTVVFIVGGGMAGATWASFVKSVEGKEDFAHTIVAYAGWTSNPYVHCDRARTDKLIAEHDSGSFYKSWMPSYYEGHTIVTFCEKYSNVLSFCCSRESASDLGKKIANGTCGRSSDDDEGGSSASTIKDAIKEVLAEWDGEVECRAVNDTIYINKIPDPTTHELNLTEGVNVIQDSVSITDVHPDTVNFLTVHWNGGEDIVFRDENLINRFGEKHLELEAVKRVSVTEESETKKNPMDDSEVNENGSMGETATKPKTSIQEVPVETVEEALSFANVEWAKIKRDNGHVLECKNVPGTEWQTGKWVKVDIPSFEEDNFMYITKLSHSESDSGWDSNMVLVDYPPGFGEPRKPEKDTDEEDSLSEEDDSEVPTI